MAFIALMLFAASVALSQASCPCADPAWCEPITKTYDHEIYTFVVSDQNWHLYDYDKVTTIASFHGRNDEMMCYAHSKGARVVLSGSIDPHNLTIPSARSAWVKARVQDVVEQHLDGMNLDFESAIPAQNTTQRDALTALVRELRAGLNDVLKNPQLSMDSPWSPNGGGRNYDYVAMNDSLDFIMIMAYDMRGAGNNAPIAWANSPYNVTQLGVQSFLKLGIPASKLVLGLPWYGYIYPCLSMDKDNVCKITKVPFRQVGCSDAAGSQSPYSTIVEKLLNRSTSGLLWDKDAQSPYFNYQAKDGTTNQVWFDNPQSLTLKYDLAIKLGLRGVGMWTADSLDYTNSPQALHQRQQMWGALPDYKRGLNEPKQSYWSMFRNRVFRMSQNEF